MVNDEKRTVVHSRVRLLDVAVLLLLVLSLVAFWQRHNLAYFFEGDRTQRSYFVSFETVGLQHEAALALEASTVIYTKTEDGTAELGVLIDELTLLPLICRAEGEDGTYYNVLMPVSGSDSHVGAAGTLSCHGVMREGKLWVGDVVLTVGENILAVGEGFEFELRVASVSENR